MLERAVTPKEATKQGLAMYEVPGQIIIYDPSHYIAKLESLARGVSRLRAKKPEPFEWDDHVDRMFEDTQGIIAYAELSRPKKGSCRGAWRPEYIAARKGYGPLIYDVAMSSSPNGLIPDRVHVSAMARPVWKYYFNNRPDVTKQPIGEPVKKGRKTTKSGCHLYLDPDEPYMDYVYNLTYPVGRSKMRNRHIDMRSKIFRASDVAGYSGRYRGDFEAALVAAAGEFFIDVFPGK